MKINEKPSNSVTPRLVMDLEGLVLADDERQMLKHPLLAGIVLFERNFLHSEQVSQLCAEVRAIRPHIIIGADHEGGRIQSVIEDRLTTIPSMREMWGRIDNVCEHEEKLAYSVGIIIGYELRLHGINMVFGPVLDLDHGKNEIIGDRAIHANEKIVEKIASAIIDGMHAAGIACCGKHFPGYGFVTESESSAVAVDERPEVDFLRDIQPYRNLIGKLDAIMTGHVVFPRKARRLASCSEYWVTQLLRNELKYAGLVIADDVSMKQARQEGTVRQTIRAALRAGSDLILVFNEKSTGDKLELLDSFCENKYVCSSVSPVVCREPYPATHPSDSTITRDYMLALSFLESWTATQLSKLHG
jgi:beta-N-acetylhexosaminidase